MMKIVMVILGVIVIASWLFVMREYRQGNERSEKAKVIMLVACLLTLVMTIIGMLERY